MLTHANMVETGQTLIKAEDVRLDDNWLAYLPMAWVGDSLYTLVINLDGRLRGQLPGEPGDGPARPARARARRAVLAPPRIWENMLTGVQVRAADAAAPQALGVRALRAPPPSGRRSSASEGKPVPLGPAPA